MTEILALVLLRALRIVWVFESHPDEIDPCALQSKLIPSSPATHLCFMERHLDEALGFLSLGNLLRSL